MFLILTLCRCQGRNQGNYQNQTQSIIINLLSCSNLRNFQWNYIKHFQHYSIILQTYYSLLLIASSFCPKNENSETALKKKIERNFARNFERNYFKKNWNFIFKIILQRTFWNTTSPNHQLRHSFTVLFPIYQNNNWTNSIILEIVEFCFSVKYVIKQCWNHFS